MSRVIPPPYLSLSVQAYEYHGLEPQLQGQFTLTLEPCGKTTLFIIGKAGANPLLRFNLSRNVAWKLSRSVFANFSDNRGASWLLQFADAQTAAQATGVIGAILTVQTAREMARFEASVPATGRGISEGDKIQITYYAFNFNPYPTIGACVSSQESYSIVLTRERLPSGLVAGLAGMVSGTTRVVYLPAPQTALEHGARDPAFPNANLVVVATLLRCKFREEGDGAEKSAARPLPECAEAAIEDLPPLPDAAEPPEARLEALERALTARLELLAAAGPVLALAAQVGAAKQEIALLNQEIEREVQEMDEVQPGAVEAAEAELAGLLAANAALEAQVRDDEAAAQQIQERMRGHEEAARARTRTLIRRMLDAVYRDGAELFDDRKLYGAAEVQNGLRAVLKQHSAACLADVQENGVF
jgi:hypothetical protein